MLYLTFNYKDGKLEDGLYEIYHDNGQLMFKGNYKDGKADGDWKCYYENGILNDTGTFINGVIQE